MKFQSLCNIKSTDSSGKDYKIWASFQTLGTQYKWQSLHSHGNHLCPCTCLAVRDKTIATAGEDGKLVVLSAEQKSPQRIIGTCMSHSVITSDTRAQMLDVILTTHNIKKRLFYEQQTNRCTCIWLSYTKASQQKINDIIKQSNYFVNCNLNVWSWQRMQTAQPSMVWFFSDTQKLSLSTPPANSRPLTSGQAQMPLLRPSPCK